jgi:CMP-N-acetylneuraminic acid synthetase
MHPLIRELEDLQFPFEQEQESVVDGPRELYNLPRQVLPDVYWQTGYVDAAWTDTIIAKNSMTGDRILPLVIDPRECVDIDSPDDWHRAERMLESGELTFEELGFLIK